MNFFEVKSYSFYSQQAFYLCLICLLAMFAFGAFYFKRKFFINRLYGLLEDTSEVSSKKTKDVDWSRAGKGVKSLADRLGRSGFVSERQRTYLLVAMSLIVLLTTAFSLALIGFSSVGSFALSAFVGVYLGALICFSYLRHKEKDYTRELMFQLPLTIEALILLVESGLGVLPAMERLVQNEKHAIVANPVIRSLRFVYELTANGMPFQQSLELVSSNVNLHVLRHVLLHLDITAVEGGELIPSLRNLSNHSHAEWKLSVETRVRRLENMVVFPVFCSVIGLVFLVAAVPAVPIKNFTDSISKNRLPSVENMTVVRPTERQSDE